MTTLTRYVLPTPVNEQTRQELLAEVKTWTQAIENARGDLAACMDSRREAIIRCHNAGLSYRQIGAAFGVSGQWVHKIVEEGTPKMPLATGS